MTEIILIRHGETEFNREGRMQGRRDSSLTEQGRGEAAALGRRFRTLPVPHAWFVSPLGRTRETSRIIREHMQCPHTLPEQTAPEIQEISCGDYEGRLRTELDPALLSQIQGRVDIPYPGGESLLDVMARARGFLESTLSGMTGRIVLITHGNFGRAFGAVAAGQDPEFALACRLDNTGICRFTSSAGGPGKFLLTGWNDIAHLETPGEPRGS